MKCEVEINEHTCADAVRKFKIYDLPEDIYNIFWKDIKQLVINLIIYPFKRGTLSNKTTGDR